MGTYLLAEERPVLETRLGRCVSAWTRFSRAVRSHAVTLFVLTRFVSEARLPLDNNHEEYVAAVLLRVQTRPNTRIGELLSHE
ncbi:hypothetical protein [Corallococcus terminator]|uniref:Transposase n=1 Tax=Corallococcus terminator TaxID=2316733 RepID=A0A3A8HMX0_9BACT|nr:hypothetical protein [Corallococcus terminator]RKG72722.1 hypothetical protein D7V88_37690 [Corallococcus terminator]